MDVDDLVRDALPVNAPYVGLVAEAYDVWLPPSGRYLDREVYRDLLAEGGGPALELGCGNGRLLVGYVADGLDVTGVDESADMLRLCRAHLDAAGLTATLVHAGWADPTPGRTYATVYNPAGSFSLVHDLDEARRLLMSWRTLVRPGGRLVLAMSGVAPTDTGWVWKVRRSGTRPGDGRTFLVHEATGLDRDGERVHALQRHEVWDRDGRLETTLLRRHCYRWWPSDRLVAALGEAGFDAVETVGPEEGYLALATLR